MDEEVGVSGRGGARWFRNVSKDSAPLWEQDEHDRNESRKYAAIARAHVMKTALFFPKAFFPPALDRKDQGMPRVHRVLNEVSITNLGGRRLAPEGPELSGLTPGTYRSTDSLVRASREKSTSAAKSTG